MRINLKLLLGGLILLVGVALSSSVWGDVTVQNVDSIKSPSIYVHGPIKEGDYRRFLGAIKDSYVRGDIDQIYIKLNSGGGRVLEAIKIGRLARELMLTSTTGLSGKCASACVLIMAGSVERIAPGIPPEVYVHRPRFGSDYFSGLSRREAREKYHELESAVREYLEDMDVPNELIGHMFRTPSRDVKQLSAEEFSEWLKGFDMVSGEWISSQCGFYSEEEDELYSKWMAGKITLDSDYSERLEQKVSGIESCASSVMGIERIQVASNLFEDTDSENARRKKAILERRVSSGG